MKDLVHNNDIRKLFFCFFLCCSFTAVRAQSFYFSHYQVEEGLSNNTVVCSLQDKYGFLWFGTRDGLNRFDGYTFKKFRHDDEDPSSVGNNLIYSLLECADSTLWVGTEQGIYRYDHVSEKFVFLKNSPKKPVRNMIDDGRRGVWLTAGSDLYRYDRSGRITSYAGRMDASTLCMDGGTLWVGSRQGKIYQFDEHENSFTGYDIIDRQATGSDRLIPKIFCDRPGTIYVGTAGAGVKIFDTKLKTFHDIIPGTDGAGIFARSFIRRETKELLIGTETGLYILNEENGKVIHIKKKFGESYTLSDNVIYTFCRDREGGIWAGTYFGGLNYLPRPYLFFEKYFPRAGKNSLSGNVVKEICGDSHGNIWIGTEDAGLNKLNLDDGVFTNYLPHDSRTAISSTNIHGLLADQDELWIGTFEKGLDVMRISTGKIIRHYRAGPGRYELKSNFVDCMLRTRKGDILIGTTAGLFLYDRAHDQFEPLRQVPETAYLTALKEDSRGRVWAVTFRDGVYMFDLHSKDQRRTAFLANIRTNLSVSRVTGITEDKDHEMWMTTRTGLLRCDLNGQVKKKYTTKDGFPADLMYTILEDTNGKLWISSSAGLSVLDKTLGDVLVFNSHDGLLTDQFSLSSAYKHPNGQLFFGSVKGLIGFDPINITGQGHQPEIRFTGLQLDNKEVIPGAAGSPLQRSILSTDHLTLGHNQSTFSLDFSALSFTAPGSVAYHYQLRGMDGHWNTIGTNRRIYYTDLPPGNYIFEVYATNNSHSWTTRTKQLFITIRPPLWKSTLAYIIYSLAFLGAFVIAINTYRKRVENAHVRRQEKFEAEKEREIYEAKIDFFTHVAHEIRIPLTLISVPMNRLISTISEYPKIEKSLITMSRNTQRLLSLINQLLDFRKTETKGYSLNFVKTDVSRLLHDIWKDFQPAAEERKLSSELILCGSAIQASIDREAFSKIVGNLLDNAMKYAAHTVITELIETSGTDISFRIRISSDGKPIPYELLETIFEPFFSSKADHPGKASTGIGLALARSLAQLHRGTLYAENIDNVMNVFVLELPISQFFEFNLEGKWKK